MSTAKSVFSFPTRTVYGTGTLNELPEHLKQLGIRKPLVVTDSGLLPTPAFALLENVLGKSSRGKTWELFSDVHPNPIESDVTGAAQAYKTAQCDAVIAFGGGSALDVGKAARLLLKKPGFNLADFDWKQDWYGLAPCVCIPTTAGTGSEVGRSSVIILDSTKRKAVFFHPGLLASLVILDPEVTRGLPQKLTAATGADALTHCIESFTSPSFHPLCDGIALEGIHLVVDALPKAVANGNDLDARGEMLVAAAMGAIAFQKDLGATHSLAHPLSSVCGMHHGLANALCLPAVMRFNSKRKPGLYRRVGIAAGLDVLNAAPADADRKTIDFVAALFEKIGIKPGLRAHGVSESQLAELSRQAFADGCHQTNPVPVTEADLRQLYIEAL
jgi:4-hydroxybutyrate dehydrogenase